MLIVGKMTLKPCPQTFGETTMIRIFHACLFAASIVTLSLTLSQVHAADDKKPAADKPKPAAKAEDTPPKDAAVDKEGWTSLFNGKDLAGWKVTKFGGEGDIYIEEGAVVISQGSDLSGIHTEQELPKSNYEVQFEAQRAAGSDFFAGLTFPVKDSHCSLIVGGWGGGVCGLSSLSGMDASEIDDKQIVDVDTTGQRISTRFEVDRSKPFGFATWQTTAKIRNVKLRPLPKTEEKPAEKDASK